MDLEDLIAALEEADGPSRDLDTAISRLGLGGEPMHAESRWTGLVGHTIRLADGLGLRWIVQGGSARAWFPGRDPASGIKAHGHTPALALCAALMKALHVAHCRAPIRPHRTHRALVPGERERELQAAE